MKYLHIVKIQDKRFVHGFEMGHPASIPEQEAWIGTLIEPGKYQFWKKEGHFMEFLVPKDIAVHQEVHVARKGHRERIVWNVADFDDRYLILKTKDIIKENA